MDGQTDIGTNQPAVSYNSQHIVSNSNPGGLRTDPPSNGRATLPLMLFFMNVFKCRSFEIPYELQIEKIHPVKEFETVFSFNRRIS